MGGHHLSLPCQLGADEASLISEKNYLLRWCAACYGSKGESDMTTHRYQLWKSKMGNTKTTSAPRLKSLPPSHNPFVQHVHRAQYQAIIWESATQSDPPDLDPNQYGWHNIVSSHAATWSVCCPHQHSTNGQMWMFHEPAMFHWEVWLCRSTYVMLNV